MMCADPRPQRHGQVRDWHGVLLRGEPQFLAGRQPFRLGGAGTQVGHSVFESQSCLRVEFAVHRGRKIPVFEKKCWYIAFP